MNIKIINMKNFLKSQTRKKVSSPFKEGDFVRVLKVDRDNWTFKTDNRTSKLVFSEMTPEQIQMVTRKVSS